MLAIVAPHLFTAAEDDEPVIQEGAVVIDEGGLIDAVGPARHVVRDTHRVVEVDGAIVPGLIDAHTHICLSASPDPGADAAREHPARIALRAQENLALHLDAGTTTIRDVGGLHGIDLELMRMVDEGLIEGPDVLAAGSVLCATGGHACFMGIECDAPHQMRRAAREQLKAGARLIKIIATGGVITPGVQPGAQQLGEDEMRAACEVAHRAGLHVAAHAQGTDGIRAALAAGVDTIEHGFWLTDDVIAHMRENDRSLVPTFAAIDAMIGARKKLPRFIQDKLDSVASPHRRSFAKAVAGGVRLVTGTDAGTPYNPHGSIHLELGAFQREGLGALNCLRAATAWAAEAIGLNDRGILARGRRADLCVFDSAVLEDAGRATNPALVVKAGRTVRGA